MFLAVLLAQIEAETNVSENSIFKLVLHSDPVVKLALLILIVFSVVSWAIIFYKYKQVKQTQSDSQNFWNSFVQFQSLNDVAVKNKKREGPLFLLFQSTIEALAQIKKSSKSSQFRKDFIYSKLAQTREEEIYKLEQYVPFLATTASTAPFIGLFGTVWGILMAFWAIGKAGSSSLATVGPYISEALVATALGLAAAIPAVIAYNHFTHRIKVIIKMMDLFLDDLILKVDEENIL